MNSFTPDAYAVAHGATDFAHEMHYTITGREHMLHAFSTGAYDKKTGLHNEMIRRAFEFCGLTPDVVRSAIVKVDGPMRPRAPHYVHYDPTLQLASTTAVETLLMRRIFVSLTPNADIIFKMARDDVGEENSVHAEDVLRIFLREVDRSEEAEREHRVMQVIHEAVSGLTLDDIKSAMVESLDVTIAKLQQESIRLKHARHGFMYTGALQGA